MLHLAAWGCRVAIQTGTKSVQRQRERGSEKREKRCVREKWCERKKEKERASERVLRLTFNMICAAPESWRRFTHCCPGLFGWVCCPTQWTDFWLSLIKDDHRGAISGRGAKKGRLKSYCETGSRTAAVTAQHVTNDCLRSILTGSGIPWWLASTVSQWDDFMTNDC